MFEAFPAPIAGGPRTLIKVLAILPFHLVNASVRPFDEMFELAAELTFRPRPGDVVWGTGRLTISAARHDRVASNANAIRLEVVVPGPDLGLAAPLYEAGETLRDVYAMVRGCKRVRVIPNGENLGEELGSALMEHIAPRSDSPDLLDGAVSFPGVEDADRVTPVRIAAPDFAAPAECGAGVSGWDRSVIYHWEAIEAPASATATRDEAVARLIDRAPVSAAPKAKASRHQAGRPKAGGAKRK